MKKDIKMTLKVLGLSTALWVAQGVTAEASFLDSIKGFNKDNLKKSGESEIPTAPPLPGTETVKKEDGRGGMFDELKKAQKARAERVANKGVSLPEEKAKAKKSDFLKELEGFKKDKLNKVETKKGVVTEDPFLKAIREKQKGFIKKDTAERSEKAEKEHVKFEAPVKNALQEKLGNLRKTETVEKSGIQLGRVVEKEPIKEEVAEEEENMLGNLFDEEEATEEAGGDDDVADYNALNDSWDDIADQIEGEAGDVLGRAGKREAQKELDDVERIMDRIAKKVGAPSDG